MRFSVFGAGASGLYTAWRLLGEGYAPGVEQHPTLKEGDTLELYDWGHYFFNPENAGTREPGARVCTWHYQDNPNASYLEVGGMRYSYWNGKNDPHSPGHRVVTTVIERLGLDKDSIPFNVSDNQLYCLRARNMYLDGIKSSNPAPYNVNNYGASIAPDTGMTTIQNLAVTPAEAANFTRRDWCHFYVQGEIQVDLPESSVFKKGDKVEDIGYWDLMFDQLGSEGYQYVADGNGYTSNVINWHTGDAIEANNEFAPGTEYRTLKTGYSSMFNQLFDAIQRKAKLLGVSFEYRYNTRLHSILQIEGKVHYWTATREEPSKRGPEAATDWAWLAMPRHSLELVAQATRYQPHEGIDVLNDLRVQNYLQSAIMQPSYKVGMFFDRDWWLDVANTPYPAPIGGYEITDEVLAGLKGFTAEDKKRIRENSQVFETPVDSAAALVTAVENTIQVKLTYGQETTLLTASRRNTIGPSVSDMPIRQVVYFGNNALDQSGTPVYGLLASYDDEQFTSFWRELEIGPHRKREVPPSADTQTLEGPRKSPTIMIRMLRSQLAAMHFGPGASYKSVPEPLETRYMDWSLPPFNAGYHAWAAHYDIADVQNKIRKPSQLLPGVDANIFVVGEAYSNDQAWVEGAYCTAESVLVDFVFRAINPEAKPIIDPEPYPFICPPRD
jgi:hypothetical protein